jgi:hypothetical protein
MKKNVFIVAAFASLFIISCNKNRDVDTTSPYNVVFKFKFDSSQARLNNIGGSASIAAGNAALSPKINAMSVHYLELASFATTLLGQGSVLYIADEDTSTGLVNKAIDFSKSTPVGNNETFLTIPIKDIAPGTYEYLRTSLAYQNLDISFRLDSTILNPPAAPIVIAQDFPATIAGFIGYKTLINNLKIKTQTVAVNDRKLQGYWGFESTGTVSGFPFSIVKTGQAPANATTVVNPIFATSPVPQGSCVVTGAFAGGSKLVITGQETKDIIVTVSLSNNKSFEWKDLNGNGKWDPTKGEQVVDMGLRGMIPSFQ